jgi:DNA replicative helicase MCM subunit Mcm2 (Cdc46/Mcm family)
MMMIFFPQSGLPICPELVREHIPKTKDVGHFLSVTGTVIRTSLVKVLEFERDYMCNKCKHVFVVRADFEQYYTFCRPSSCPSLESCDSSKFTCLSGLSSSPARCRDYQEIKIQEQVNDQINEKNNKYEELVFCYGQIARIKEYRMDTNRFLSSLVEDQA